MDHCMIGQEKMNGIFIQKRKNAQKHTEQFIHCSACSGSTLFRVKDPGLFKAAADGTGDAAGDLGAAHQDGV